MEALGQIIAAIVAFVIEVTFHAIVFVFYLILGIFSPRYREKLRAKRETSAWNKFCLSLGITMYSVALIFALLFWTPFMLRDKSDITDKDEKDTLDIQLSHEEAERIKKTTEIDELVDVAGEIIKRKLDDKKDADGQNAD